MPLTGSFDSPPLDPQVHYVLQRYGLATDDWRVTDLGGAGGFSGACFWRMEPRPGKYREIRGVEKKTTSPGSATPVAYCLRRWPREHPSASHLAWIHHVLRHVYAQGLTCVPVPIAQGAKFSPNETEDSLVSAGALEHRLPDRRATFVTHADHLWELTPWMPGRADYRERPSAAKLAAALRTLARFHQAARTALGHLGETREVSPGARYRLELLRAWSQGDAAKLAAGVDCGGRSELLDGLAPRARELMRRADQLAPRWAEWFVRTPLAPVPLQACIRDIWHDHVLFEGDEVSGIVDFGAMRRETVSGDIARLLGSLAGNDPAAWQAGLRAYEEIRPLEHGERELIPFFDRSGVLLGGLNWLRWIYLEGRRFDGARVLTRLDDILDRLGAF